MRLCNLLVYKVESWQQGCLATIQIFFTITLVANKRAMLQITEEHTAFFHEKTLNNGILSNFASGIGHRKTLPCDRETVRIWFLGKQPNSLARKLIFELLSVIH